jgi:putative phosphoribosyl transferase
MVHVGQVVDWPHAAFEHRADAGRRLAAFLLRHRAAVDVVVAIPSGGVAVAKPVAERLGVPLDMVLVRKLPLPMAPEAGFGAVTLDGEMRLNDRLATGLSEAEIRRVAHGVIEGLREREEVLMAGRLHVDVAGKDAVLIDDGLASGFTMMAAAGELRARGPRSLSVAVPDAPMNTIEAVEPLVDAIYCLVAQRSGSFAVASFYRHWHDMSDAEVIALLRDRDTGA